MLTSMVFSWQMAEELAAAHLRSLGFVDARRTPDGVDGGIDVRGSSVAAQVKYQLAPVGAPIVQQLRGAAHGVEHAVFYASGGFTASAITAANVAEIALFSFGMDNDVWAVNDLAQQLTFVGSRPPEWADTYRARLADLRHREAAWTQTVQAGLRGAVAILERLMQSAADGNALDVGAGSLYERAMEFQALLAGRMAEQQEFVDRLSEAGEGLERSATEQNFELCFEAAEANIAARQRFATVIGELTGEDLRKEFERRYLDFTAAGQLA
jgi:hypothetical protein